ncbi:hypothetical protein MUK42_15504 [Musa troglodytarum]|uniref:Uncharacterized protein n=1 Tax=Musa troglodytarum TaxID=320322 RepID=A0A9E7H6U7_9LILI|nr:hypothetical protein MUK42_15504 [Musa troglodytarum]
MHYGLKSSAEAALTSTTSMAKILVRPTGLLCFAIELKLLPVHEQVRNDVVIDCDGFLDTSIHAGNSKMTIDFRSRTANKVLL